LDYDLLFLVSFCGLYLLFYMPFFPLYMKFFPVFHNFVLILFF